MRERRTYPVILAVFAASMGWLAWRHVGQLRHGHVTNVGGVAVAAFVWMTVMSVLAHSHRDILVEPSNAQQSILNRLRVSVVIPVFNEDPVMFAATLQSLSDQSRLPQRVIVVDDGSDSEDCHREFQFWYVHSRPTGLDAQYLRQPNSGKREAQARAFRTDPFADIYVTVDSDVVLDRCAVEFGLMPFTRRRVMSVAGFLVGANQRTSILTRLVELGFVNSFLNGRAQYSALGSVTVNSGGLAFYRSHVVQDNLAFYLKQRVMGRKVASGDDAMLTRLALIAGRTVFQRRAWGVTLHPTNLRHLSKQRTRWWRSFWWGNFWFLQHFQSRRVAWWLVCWGFVTSAWMGMVVPTMVWRAVNDWHVAVSLLEIMSILSYLGAVRYLSLIRDDEPGASQWLTFALAPLAMLLQLYLGFVLQWIAFFTFARTGWSTRSVVEVGLETVT